MYIYIYIFIYIYIYRACDKNFKLNHVRQLEYTYLRERGYWGDQDVDGRIILRDQDVDGRIILR